MSQTSGIDVTCSYVIFHHESVHMSHWLQVEEWMSQTSGIPLEELRHYMFLYHDQEATEHIMRVSGGLDSLVMGEGQILAQVCFLA